MLAARDGHHRRRKGWQWWCLSSPIDACAWCHNNNYSNDNAGGNDNTNQNNNQQTWAACYAIGSSPLNPAESEFLSTMGGYLLSSRTVNASGDKSDYTAISNKRQGLNYEFGGCGWLELEEEGGHQNTITTWVVVGRGVGPTKIIVQIPVATMRTYLFSPFYCTLPTDHGVRRSSSTTNHRMEKSCPNTAHAPFTHT